MAFHSTYIVSCESVPSSSMRTIIASSAIQAVLQKFRMDHPEYECMMKPRAVRYSSIKVGPVDRGACVLYVRRRCKDIDSSEPKAMTFSVFKLGPSSRPQSPRCITR